jgi:hypothetical protein
MSVLVSRAHAHVTLLRETPGAQDADFACHKLRFPFPLAATSMLGFGKFLSLILYSLKEK